MGVEAGCIIIDIAFHGFEVLRPSLFMCNVVATSSEPLDRNLLILPIDSLLPDCRLFCIICRDNTPLDKDFHARLINAKDSLAAGAIEVTFASTKGAVKPFVVFDCSVGVIVDGNQIHQ